jgi:hypothetical protein
MSITAANAVITFTIPGIFAAPQQIKGFAADEVFSTDTLESSEEMMGVDGELTAGFVFVPVRQQYTLMADSVSIAIFDQWWQFNQAALEAYPAYGTITLPSKRSQYALQKGFLKGYKPLPDAKKLLQPQQFAIVWQRIIASPVSAVSPIG